MDPHIKAACGTRLAVNDARSLGKLASERGEQRLLAQMPWLGGHNASAVRADVAGEGPFGSPRFLRSCKVHRNLCAVAPLDPSVGKQRGVPPRWSGSIHGLHALLKEKRSSFAALQAAVLTTSMPPCWLETMRKNPYFSCGEIPEKGGEKLTHSLPVSAEGYTLPLATGLRLAELVGFLLCSGLCGNRRSRTRRHKVVGMVSARTGTRPGRRPLQRRVRAGRKRRETKWQRQRQ